MTASSELTYRGRFAPSPTGPLHLGSLLAALGSWLLARRAGGEWLVRIEDLDPLRKIAGAAHGQLRTLSAFGLESDGPVLRQSTRGAAYQAALDRLLETGDAFACHCTRGMVGARVLDAGVHRRCAARVERPHPAIRFRVRPGTIVRFGDLIQGDVSQDVGIEVGDFVVKRADGPWAYQLAVVVDDAAQAITDVVRGADLLDSTPRQILLQRALGLPTPRHAHLPPIVDANGRKLSKSLSAMPIEDADPLPALRAAWRLLGQPGRALACAGSVSTLLSIALREFDPALIPCVPQREPQHHGEASR